MDSNMNKPLHELTKLDIDSMTLYDLRIYLTAALAVLRMRDVEIERLEIDKHLAVRDFNGAEIERHRALLVTAERIHKEGRG